MDIQPSDDSSDGAGRVTFGLEFYEHQIDESLDTLVPLATPQNGIFYFNPKLSLSDRLNPSVSLGFGYRHLFEGPQIILGGNIFYDSDYTNFDHHVNQFGVGAEVMSRWVDFRANYYLPEQNRRRINSNQTVSLSQKVTSSTQPLGPLTTSDTVGYSGHNLTETINGMNQTLNTFNVTNSETTHFWEQYEGAMRGVDTEMGFLIPGLDKYAETRIFGGYYFYENPFGKNLSGFKGRLEVRALPSITFDAAYYQNKEIVGSNWYYGIRVSAPFDIGKIAHGQNPFAGFTEGFKPQHTSDAERFASRLTENIIRNPHVATSQSKFIEVGQKTVAIDPPASVVTGTPFTKTVVLTMDGTPITITHVDSGAAVAGDGTVAHPYMTLTLADADAIKRTIVLLRAGSTFNSQTITLAPNQLLIGLSKNVANFIKTDQLGTIKLPNIGNSTVMPTITNPGGTIVNVATNNTISGLNLTNAARAIAAPSGTTNLAVLKSTISNMTIAGLGLDLNPVTNTTVANVTFSGNNQDVVINGSNTTIANVTSTGATHGSIDLITPSGTNTLSNVAITGASDFAVRSTNAAAGSTNNFIRFSATGGAAGVDIEGGAGTFNFDSTTAMTNTGGASLLINGGSANVNYFGNVTQAMNAPAVAVLGGHTGTVQFSGGTVAATAGPGLQFNNANGTYNFLGTTTLTGGANLQILNNSAGTFGFSTGASIVNGNGQDILIDSSTASLHYSGSASTNSGTLLQVNNHSTGTLQFDTGTLAATGGVGLQFNNASGTYELLGTTTLTGGANLQIVNNSAGAFTFGTGASIVNGSGQDILVDGGTSSLTYSGSASTNSGTLLQVNNHSTGTLQFDTGTLSATGGNGLQFNNADGTYKFLGTTTLNGTAAGVSLTSGSDGTFLFDTATTITNPSGTAFFVNGGTSNITYSGNITANSAFALQVLNHSTGTISFNTGNITQTAGNGVQFVNDSGIYNLADTRVSNSTGSAIDVENSASGTFNFSTVKLVASAGTAVQLNNAGTVNLLGGTIDGAGGNGIFSLNTTLTATGMTLGGDHTKTISGIGVQVINNDGTARTVTVSNDSIRSNSVGIQTNDGGNKGELTLVLDGNTLETLAGGAAAMSITGGALNSTIVKSMNGGTVLANGTGGGLIFNQVTFDASGNALSGTQVNAGTWNIGQGTAANQRVLNDGLHLFGPTGDLSFTTLNIFNNAGTGLFVDTKTLGTTFSLSNTGGTIDTTGGTAMNLDPLTTHLTFTSVTSANSGGAGVIVNGLASGSTLTIGTTTVTASGGSGIVVQNSNGAILNFGTTTVTNAGGSGIDLSGAGGASVTFGTTLITNPGASGINMSGATGTFNFGDTTINGTAAGQTAFNLNGGNADVTAQSLNINGGGIGIDLRNTINGHTVSVTNGGTIQNVGVGVQLGGGTTGDYSQTADAFFTYDVTGGHNSTISGTVAIEARGLVSTASNVEGTYDFRNVTNILGAENFEPTAGTPLFVAASAHGTGDGSTPQNAAAYTAIAGAPAGTFIILVNDGNTINIGASTITLQNNDHVDTFGNGRTFSAGTAPINILLPGVAQYTDPFGHGAATITGTGTLFAAANGDLLQNFTMTLGGGTGVSASGINGLTVTGLTINGTGNVFSLTNTTGSVNLTNNTINVSGGTLLSVNGGSATVNLTAGTGSITNSGGAGVNIANTTGGSVTITDVNVTGAASTPLVFDNNKATFNITGSTFAANSGVTLLNVDTTVGGSTTTLAFNNTNTLTQTSGAIAIIGAGARDIDLSAQNFTNSGTTAANVINVTGQTGGTISFGNVGITGYNNAAGTAVNLQGTGGTVSFGDLDVATTAGAGVNVGAITFAPGSSPTISAAGGPALVMTGTTLSGGAATFDSVTASNAGAANSSISLTNVIGSTTLSTVNLSGTQASGITLNNAGTVAVLAGNINGSSGDAINSTNTALTATGLTITALVLPGGNGITIANNDGVARVVTLSNDNIISLGEGIHTTDGGHAGELSLVLDGNTIETNSGGTLAIHVIGSALNSTTINSMNGDTVMADGSGSGALFNQVTFDAVTGGAIQQVNAGNWNIGQGTAANQRVSFNGLDFEGATGSLTFGTLNIFNNQGTGLVVNTKTLGTTFSLGNTGGTIDTSNGAAMNLDPLTANLTFSGVKSTNSTTSGVILNTVGGTVALGAVTVTGATGTGLSMVNSSAAVTASSVTVNGAATGLQFGTNTGGSFTVSGATSLTNITGTGINANGATGTYQFAGLTIGFTGAGRGLDLRNSDVALTTGTLSITGNGTAGSIGIDLSGSTNPNGVNSATPNILLATGAAQTATIGNVATGVLLGDVADGSAGAYMKFGNQTPTTSGGSGSSISVIAGGTTIDTTNLVSTSGFVQGRYEFTGVAFTGNASFQHSASFFFVAANATGTGDGSTVNDRANAATLLTDLGTNSLANKTIVLINDGNVISLGNNTAQLDTLTNIDGFGNGNSVAAFSVPANVIVDAFTGTISDPTGNGAATLTANAGHNVITLTGTHSIKDITITGGDFLVSGTTTGLTLQGVTLTNGGVGAISLTNASGVVNITNNTVSQSGGRLLDVNGGTAGITFAAGTGSISNTGGSGISIKNTTGGNVTLTGLSVTGATATPLTFDNNKATFAITNSTFAVNSGVTLLNVDTTTGGSTTALTFGATDTLTQTSGEIAIIGAGARNIDLSAQNFTNTGTTAANVINVTGQTGGTIAFGTINIVGYNNAAGTAVNLQGTGGTDSFVNLTVGTTAGAGVNTGAITFAPGSSPSISAAGGPALVMNGTTLSGGAATFSSVTASNAGAGNAAISLTNVIGATTFTTVNLSGTATNGIKLSGDGAVTVSGGTINGTSGDGITSTNTALTVTGVTIGGTSAPAGNGVTIVNNDGTARLVTLSNDTITAGGNGIATTDGGHLKELTLVLDGDTLQTNTLGKFALSVTGSALNSTIIKSMSGGTVNGGANSGGVLFNRVTFDASGTALSGTQVNAGNWNIGQSTVVRVQGNALDFEGPTGNLAFGTLNIFNNNGTGLLVNTKTLGTTFSLSNTGGAIDTTAGTAANLDPLTANLTFTSVKSTNATTSGVILNTVGGTANLGAVTVSGATGSGLSMVASSANVTLSSLTVTTSANGLTFGTNTGTFEVTGNTSLSDTTTGIVATNSTGTYKFDGTTGITAPTGISANGASGSWTFTGNTTINFSGANRGLDLQNSNLTQFSTGNITITGDGTTAGSIGIDLSGSLYPSGQPVGTTSPNISLATGAGKTAAISGVTTGIVLGNAANGSAGAYLRYGNQTAGNSGSSIAVNSGGVTIDTSHLTSVSASQQGRYEFTGVTFTGQSSFEGTNPNFIFVGSASAGGDSGADPNDRISITQFLASDNTSAFLAGKTVIFVNDNAGAGLTLTGTLNLGTGTTIESFGNGASVTVTGGVQPINVIGDNFHPGGGTFSDPTNGAATLKAAAGIDLITLGNGDTVQNINLTTGNNQIIGSGTAGFTMAGVSLTNAAASAISLTNATGTITMTGGGISGAGGPSFFVSGGSATISYSGTIANTAGHSVQVQGITGGSVTLSGAVTDTGTGILVQNNTGGTITFSGVNDSIHTGANQAVTLSTNTGAKIDFTGNGLSIQTTTATGFGASGGGTVGVSGTGDTITSTTGTALSLNGVGIDTGGFNLQSVSANGAVNGIALNNLTGAPFNSVSISGGTIQNTTGAAVSLTNLGSLNGGVILTNMTISGASGIVGTNFGTLATSSDSVSGTAGAGLSLTTGTITTGSTFSTLSSTGGTNGVLLSGVGGSFTASAGSLATASGAAWSESGGTVSATYNGTISQLTAANAISIANETSGTTTFGGAITATTTTANAINLASNTGATIVFSNTSGNSAITTTSGNGFNITGGGTVNITGNSYILNSTSGIGYNATGGTVSATGTGNTITSTTGTALNVAGATIAATGLTFKSITTTTSSANAGIILDGTGALGGLTVTGTGSTAGSGGTISNKASADILTGTDSGGQTVSGTGGTGIFLRNTMGVSLNDMQLNDFSNFAIYGKNVTGFNLSNSTISGTNGTNGGSNAEEASIRFDNLLTNATFTTATISNSNISGGAASNLYIANTSGTLNRLTMTNNTFGFVSSTVGNNNIDIQAYNSGTTLNVSFGTVTAGTGNTITGSRGALFETIANQNSTMDVVIRQNTFQNNQTSIISGGGEVDVRSGASGGNTTLTFDISHNTWTAPAASGSPTPGAAFFVSHDNDSGTMSGTINANTITGGTFDNMGDGIFVRASGSGTSTVLISNNTISNFYNDGIALQNNSGSGTMNATIIGNTITNNANGVLLSFAAIDIENGATAGDTTTMNIQVGSATVGASKNSFAGAGGVIDIELSNFNGSTTLDLYKAGSGSSTPAGVIVNDNTGTPSVDTTGGTGSTTLTTTAPPLPPAVAP